VRPIHRAMDFVTVGAAKMTVIVKKNHNFYTKNAQRKNQIFWCIGHGQTILITSNYIYRVSYVCDCVYVHMYIAQYKICTYMP
jgi:hypothetical protein